jgi:putative phage-type endonuclease
MKTKNLILTKTSGMSREDWLNFRQPTFHVKNNINEFLKAAGISEEDFWRRSEASYRLLQDFFSSDQWKNFLFPVIGASEISPILGLSPYKSSIELYYEKIGVKEVFDNDNVAMFWGRELEEQIAQKWQYWDGSPEGMIENFKNENIIRKCRRLNAYVQHKDFPWLFASLDRVINKQNIIVADEAKANALEEGSLECKTISGFSANMWEHGIPPMYVAQLQTQLIASETQYGEIAILKDGRYFEVYPFDRHEVFCERIITESRGFFDRVKKGIEQYFLWKVAPEIDQQNLHSAGYDQLSPEPDGSEAYKAYLSQTYQNSIAAMEVEGGVAESELARQYAFLNGRVKDLEYIQTECSNKLKAFMKEGLRP